MVGGRIKAFYENNFTSDCGTRDFIVKLLSYKILQEVTSSIRTKESRADSSCMARHGSRTNVAYRVADTSIKNVLQTCCSITLAYLHMLLKTTTRMM